MFGQSLLLWSKCHHLDCTTWCLNLVDATFDACWQLLCQNDQIERLSGDLDHLAGRYSGDHEHATQAAQKLGVKGGRRRTVRRRRV